MAITTTPHHLETGSPAPPFEGTDENGHMHRLSEYRGQTLVLMFLPHDTGRPGRDRHAHFPGSQLEGVYLLGVMIGTPEKVGEWKRRSEAPFPILADVHAAVTKAYGMMELMAREHHPGFVAIGPDGSVKVVLKHRGKPGHVYELLKRAEGK